MTFTYFELEHAQHVLLLGVVADIATQNQPFVYSSRGQCRSDPTSISSKLESQASSFAVFDSLFDRHYNSPWCPKLQIRPFSTTTTTDGQNDYFNS